MAADLLRAALSYAQELGWAVFPLKPGDKVPLTTHGLKDATTDVEQITAWWTERPMANIGIATGEVSSIVVVDVDGPQGEAALARFGFMPDTPSSLTGKGRHLIFRRPPDGLRNSAGRLGPQIDIRGDGGYIVAPPSVHPSGGKYAWSKGAHPLKVSVAEFPVQLLEHLNIPSIGRHEGARSAAEIPLMEQVPEGQRNQTLAEYAGRLLAKNHGELETLELVRLVNAQKCNPPLPPDEVERIVMSIASSDRRNRDSRAREAFQPASDFQAKSSLIEVDRSVFDVLADRNTLPIDVIPTMLAPWSEACRGFGGGQGLPRGWHVTVGGASGTGKSLFALNLVAAALHHGHRVAYISLEMSVEQLLARLLAIFGHRHIRELEPGPLYAPETYEAAVAQLLDKCQVGAGLYIAERPSQDLTAVQAQTIAAVQNGCRLIVIDYLQLVNVAGTDGIAEQTRRVSQMVQRLAFDEQVTTLALSQFNRATSFAKESPTVHGLTGSSAIENDSDQVLLLDHSQNERQAATLDTRVLLAKNRHGPQATIHVRWDYNTLTLKEREPNLDESAKIHGIRTGPRA